MLVPRESDIPALFLVFVFLPLVSYFILGKWSEASKRKERLSLIASGAADEALRVNDMAVVGSIMPLVHLPNTNSGIRQCARCFAPATTRCSQCKAVWYCSGRCQIVHWRHVHKLECQHLGSSPKHLQIEGSLGGASYAETVEQCTFKYDNALSEDIICQRSAGIDALLTGHRDSSEEVAGAGFAQPLEDAYVRDGDFPLPEHRANSPHVSKNGDDDLRGGALHENDVAERESLGAFDGGNNHEILTTAISGTNESKGLNCFSERNAAIRSSKSRIASPSNGTDLHNSPKSRMKMSKEPLSSDTEIINVQTGKESRIATLKDDIPLQENNNLGLMKVAKSTKVDHHRQLEDSTIKKRKVKMIFPYEEFVKYFQYEAFNVAPRGLINCGNSCYANAVLQCLACTKPLIIYLLRQSHSKAGCTKDWCLVCELEQLVLMLRQTGCPLSPLNILVYIRGLNTQIGDGSQEDAHEFLRLLVASMQAIFLEGYGGENAADPRLQDTTFIQHTFGGCLRSKVKCLRCHHESERDEKMMDLTLEIFGWVKSLEDALTQFTNSEYLDGDNMYRCARCAAYVRARKQLNIKEAPNILTIVLKRFQEGNYGKISKCITFPEMLDMTPYMTGTDDIPPLYMLYAVVVHLDTSNASFSGHYISYVKDLLGNWFMVDDTEVQPVEVNHVMSQEAYILFYMRSYPRPARKATRYQMKAQRSPRPEQSVPNQIIIERSEPHSGPSLETNLVRQSRSRPSVLKKFPEFSDATSSDWSLFTSSDDSSFTTESTRDSFSTVDHTEVPSSSIFQPVFPAESSPRRSLSSRVLPDSKPQTRFAREGGDHSGVNRGIHEARQGPTQTYVNCTI